MNITNKNFQVKSLIDIGKSSRADWRCGRPRFAFQKFPFKHAGQEFTGGSTLTDQKTDAMAGFQVFWVDHLAGRYWFCCSMSSKTFDTELDRTLCATQPTIVSITWPLLYI
mmetsp:Transcript_21750/g.60449  ORF Transcript_21750/g.60449 Transcript_21750/m.60449 type:complete len:111 (+) Transcript_21750:2053-2385(+)